MDGQIHFINTFINSIHVVIFQRFGTNKFLTLFPKWTEFWKIELYIFNYMELLNETAWTSSDWIARWNVILFWGICHFMASPVGLSQLIIDELKLEKNICKNKRTRAPPHLDLGYLCTENLNQLTFAYFALPATTKLFLTWNFKT